MRRIVALAMLVASSSMAQGFATGGLKSTGERVTGVGISPSTVTASGAAAQFICTDTGTCELRGGITAANASATVAGITLSPTVNATTLDANDLLLDVKTKASGTTVFKVDLEGDGTFGGDLAVAGNDVTGTATGATFTITSDTNDVTTSATVAAITLRPSVNVTAGDLVLNIEDSAGVNLVTIDEEGDLSVGAGAAATPSYSFTGDTDTGFYSKSANVIGMSTSGALELSLGGGNTIALEKTTSTNTIVSNTSAATATSTVASLTLGSGLIVDANDLVINVENNGGTNLFTVDAEGDVVTAEGLGIGGAATGTASRNAIIYGGTGDAVAGLMLRNSVPSATANLGFIDFQSGSTTVSRIRSQNDGATTSTGLLFQTAAVGVLNNSLGINNAGRVIVNGSLSELTGSNLNINGNMGIGATFIATAAPTNGLIVQSTTGIGTTSPDRLFHAEVSTALTNTVQQVARLSHITSGIPANSIGLGLEFEQETTADNNEVVATMNSVVTDVTALSEDADLVFNTMAAGAAAAERLRISSTGLLTVTTSGTLQATIGGGNVIALEKTASTNAIISNTSAVTVTSTVASMTLVGGVALDANDLVLNVENNAGTNLLTVDAEGDVVTNGRLGIGQSPTAEEMELGGTSTDTFFRVQPSDTGTVNQAGVELFQGANRRGSFLAQNTANAGTQPGAAGDVVFTSQAALVLTAGGVSQNVDHIHVSSTGLVGIGAAAGAGFELDVTGDIRASANVTIGGGTAITKHLSTTASLDFDLSGAGITCQDLTVTVTGAADGDSVTTGVPNALASTAGVTFNGFVSAANTVTVRACDVTSGNPNPAAATVRADVWQH